MATKRRRTGGDTVHESDDCLTAELRKKFEQAERGADDASVFAEQLVVLGKQFMRACSERDRAVYSYACMKGTYESRLYELEQKCAE